MKQCDNNVGANVFAKNLSNSACSFTSSYLMPGSKLLTTKRHL
jgi:hypothetical protein